MSDDNLVDSPAQLRGLYADPKGRSLSKQLDRLDTHCMRFIALSPFVVIASGRADGSQDASPRGGEPGFVSVVDEKTLLIPDAPGNNRLDSMGNIVENGKIGLLFLVPGVDETLRVNGGARLTRDPALLGRFPSEKRAVKLAIEVSVSEAYLHCAKALMRSRLWAIESRNERSVLPSMGKMLNDQIGIAAEPETQEQMVARYADEL